MTAAAIKPTKLSSPRLPTAPLVGDKSASSVPSSASSPKQTPKADTFEPSSSAPRPTLRSLGLPRITTGALAAGVTLAGTAALGVASAYATGFFAWATYMSYTTSVGGPTGQIFAMTFMPGATVFAAAICRRATRDLLFFGKSFSDLYRTCKNEGAAAARKLAHTELRWPAARRAALFAGAALAGAALSMPPALCASMAAMSVGYGALSLMSFAKGAAPLATHVDAQSQTTDVPA